MMAGASCIRVASVFLEEAAIDPASQRRVAANRDPAPARAIVALAAQIAHDGAVPDAAHDIGLADGRVLMFKRSLLDTPDTTQKSGPPAFAIARSHRRANSVLRPEWRTDSR